MQAETVCYDDWIDRAAAGIFPSAIAADRADPSALRLTLIGLDEIDAPLRAEWRDLVLGSAAPNPCFAPSFLEPAMREHDPSREVKLCLLRWGEEELLVGLAPVVFQTGYAKLPLKHVSVWTHEHCVSGAPLVRDGFDVAVLTRFIDWIDTRPQGACFIRFAKMPFDRRSHLAFDEACDLRGRNYRIQAFEERATMTDERTLESKPFAQVNVPAKRIADRTLLGTAATVEAIINFATRRPVHNRRFSRRSAEL